LLHLTAEQQTSSAVPGQIGPHGTGGLSEAGDQANDGRMKDTAECERYDCAHPGNDKSPAGEYVYEKAPDVAPLRDLIQIGAVLDDQDAKSHSAHD
jgi:hypothetical protein